ncbi:MAG: hypothetical protein GEU28_05630 [Dehalococcoidia bacterium]|nr:hypothetical protein [Dehalococcoidia bacterium]
MGALALRRGGEDPARPHGDLGAEALADEAALPAGPRAGAARAGRRPGPADPHRPAGRRGFCRPPGAGGSRRRARRPESARRRGWRQQQLGAARLAHGVRQAAPGRRSASRAGSPQCLLPGAHLLSSVRRHRPLLRRDARLHPLRPQRRVAWSVTHAFADTQDFFVERFDSSEPLRWEFSGEWHEALVNQETISVRDGAPETVEVVTTRHGGVVLGDPRGGTAVSFRWTSTAEPDSSLEAVLPMLLARSVDEINEAMRHWVDPCNNFVSADTDGNIAYLTRGRVPVRSKANAWLPVPGWTGWYEWTGDVPFDEMPRMRNPEGGLIVTANNRIVGSEYAHYIGMDYRPPSRAQRILVRLEGVKNATLADAAAIHADRVSIPALRLKDRVVAVVSADGHREVEALDLLREWDGSMGASSPAAAIYTAVRDTLTGFLMDQRALSPVRNARVSGEPPNAAAALRSWRLLPGLLNEDNHGLLDPGEDWDSLVGRAWTKGLAWLEERLGPEVADWSWGSLHRTAPVHPLTIHQPELAPLLNPPSVSIGGDGDTVQATSSLGAGVHTIGTTSVARYAFDLADWGNSRWVVPLGASGHPGSPHYADQADAWGDLELFPMRFDWSVITDEAETRQVLPPATSQTRSPQRKDKP